MSSSLLFSKKDKLSRKEAHELLSRIFRENKGKYFLEREIIRMMEEHAGIKKWGTKTILAQLYLDKNIKIRTGSETGIIYYTNDKLEEVN